MARIPSTPRSPGANGGPGAPRPEAPAPLHAPLRLRQPEALDAVGVGIGPFNLSVAALLHPLELRARFYERAPELRWHAGLMFPEATIQVSHFKDLVTLADPTSEWSFLSFLFRQKRLYHFLNAAFPRVTRREFEQYLRWVADSLPSLRFGAEVRAVSLDAGGALAVETDTERVRTRAVVVGTGLAPAVPPCALPHLGSDVFHAYGFLSAPRPLEGKTVAVVGGGQTGAEVVRHLLAGGARPASLTWISRRANFSPLDESPFANELFTPSYSDHFYQLDGGERARLLEEQKLASDGITPELVQEIYRLIYEREHLDGIARPCRLLPGRELVDMAAGADGARLILRGRGGERQTVHAEVVVLATGAEYRLPPCLEPLAGRIPLERGEPVVREDYSVAWDGPPELRIYVQNAARARRGVPDRNLSLMAWRSALIVNSLCGHRVYDVAEPRSLVEWDGAEESPLTGATPDERDPHLGALSPAGVPGA